MSKLAFILPESLEATDQRAKSLTQVARRARLPANDPATLYLLGLADSSQETMRAELQRIARFFGHPVAGFPWWELTPMHVDALRAFVRDTRAPAGANLTLCALRGVLDACVTLELVTDALRRRLHPKAVAGSREPAGRCVSTAELVQVFDYLRSRVEPIARREAAVLALLYGAGLRRSEVVKLRVEDVAPRGLLVRGKGNKQRIVPMPPGTARAVEAWLEVRGPAPGDLFVAVHLGTRIDLLGRAIRAKSLYNAVVRVVRRAGLPHFSCHDLRRTYIGDLFDRQVDLATVQKLAGHATPGQTSSYDRRPARVRELAVQKLDVPFG